ncbi:MAG: VWA domain-containing protein [Gammaproteobacteria bacterium]|nr:VWA domain-containing protein [Gammaproteobacteria bacterium]MBU1654700.1 VWA domain-containing protein [Gammaproteobacteria bacterium]MBU1961424.1 VWA domain-containing protein [Gammaproteobacteria bacterium]
MKMTIRTGLMAALLGLCLPLSALAADYPEVTFILDASGSMLGMAGDKTKMTAAKEVMAQVVPGLAPEARVGLVAYGHRRKGDCSDIEVLIPSGSEDRTGLMEKVTALQPMGKTPITGAVGSVVEQLKTKENETSIVLVSDGIETCAADPCKRVGDLKATGIKFVMHVVGFGVGGQGAEQLSCLAKAGGGQYLSANDAPSLLNALTTVSQEVAKQVEVVKAKATQTAAKSGLGKVHLTMPEGTTGGMAGLRIIRVKDGKVIKATEGLGADSSHPLPAGEYALEYLFATPNYGEPTVTQLGRLKVNGGETREVRLGGIAFNLAEALTKAAVFQVIIADAASGTPLVTVNDNGNGYYNFLPKAVLAGKYNVLIHYAHSPKPSLVARDVLVKPGEETTLTLDAGLIFKEATGTDIGGWDLIPLSSAATADQEEDASQPADPVPLLQARPPHGNKSTLWTPYLVPPGKYRLLVHVVGMGEPLPVAEELEIPAGQIVNFDSGL